MWRSDHQFGEYIFQLDGLNFPVATLCDTGATFILPRIVFQVYFFRFVADTEAMFRSGQVTFDQPVFYIDAVVFPADHCVFPVCAMCIDDRQEMGRLHRLRSGCKVPVVGITHGVSGAIGHILPVVRWREECICLLGLHSYRREKMSYRNSVAVVPAGDTYPV